MSHAPPSPSSSTPTPSSPPVDEPADPKKTVAAATAAGSQHGSSRVATSNNSSSFPFIPRQFNQSFFKAALPFPRLYSGPLFAAPSVSVSHTHIVSSSVGPLTPPLAIDSLPTPVPSNNNTAAVAAAAAATAADAATTTDPCNSNSKLRMVVIAQPSPPHHHQQQQSHDPLVRRRSFAAGDVVHDMYTCMFRITLDSKGTIAALCYLPTRFQKMVEFYHTEIPAAYRDLGLGDLLVAQGLGWAEAARLLVIPTCPFVRRFLDRSSSKRPCIVDGESEGVSKLMLPSTATATATAASGGDGSPPGVE